MKNVVKISTLLMTLYSGTSLAILSDSPKAKANLKGLVRSQGISEASADRVVRQLITESARNSSLSMKKGQQGPLIARITAIRGELSAAAGGDVSVAPPSRAELTAMAPGLMAASAATVESAASAFVGSVQARYDAILAEIRAERVLADTTLREVNIAVGTVTAEADLGAKLAILNAEAAKERGFLDRIEVIRRKVEEIRTAIADSKPVTPATLTDAETELATAGAMIPAFNTDLQNMRTDYIFTKAAAASLVSQADADRIVPGGGAININGTNVRFVAEYDALNNDGRGNYYTTATIKRTFDEGVAAIDSIVYIYDFGNILRLTGLNEDDWNNHLSKIKPQFALRNLVADRDGNLSTGYLDNRAVRLVDTR